MKYFVATIPGLSAVVSRATKRQDGVIRVTEIGSDGRTDLLLVETERGAPVPRPAGAEDVFVAVGEARGVRGLPDLLRKIWDEKEVARALSVYGAAVAPLKGKMAYRVIARVRTEELFLRTEGRDALAKHIGAHHPRWLVEDPAQLEFWFAETVAGVYVLGLRLTPGPRSGRAVHRPGSLRRSVADAMVWLAGSPRGVLLDMFCGTGTIVAAAERAGWIAFGSDLDPSVLPAAVRNAGRPVVAADARALPYAGADAIVSNMPWGQQFPMIDDLGRALAGMARVLAHNGRVVLLGPDKVRFARAIEATDGLHLIERHAVEVLGEQAALFVLVRD